MSYELKDYLNAINFNKKNLMDSEDTLWQKKYPSFIVNKILSGFQDCIMFVNEMNRNHFVDKDMQFHFLLNSIRKRKRFGGKWVTTAKSKNLEYVKEYYGYSNAKAKVALDILDKKQLNLIKEKLDKGGRKR